MKKPTKRTPFKFTIEHEGILYNSIGYTKENCVACCKQCNRCKGKMTLVEFKTWIKAIHDNLLL